MARRSLMRKRSSHRRRSADANQLLRTYRVGKSSGEQAFLDASYVEYQEV